jgi:hypothetical protein
LIPRRFRKRLMAILELYTNGYCQLEKEDWIPVERPSF